MTQDLATPALAPTPLSASLHRTFMGGASLELPQGAALFSTAQQSNLKLNIQSRFADLGNDFFEVSLGATLDAATPEGRSQYLVEVNYSGIFQLQNGSAEDRTRFLEVAAPTILTPHLRAQVADMLVRATLPVFYIPEMDWASAVAQRQAQQAGATAAALVPGPAQLQ